MSNTKINNLDEFVAKAQQIVIILLQSLAP